LVKTVDHGAGDDDDDDDVVGYLIFNPFFRIFWYQYTITLFTTYAWRRRGRLNKLSNLNTDSGVPLLFLV